MKVVLLLGVVVSVLTACGSAVMPRGTTHVQLEGSVCRQPLRVQLADGKERKGFTAYARCADGSIVRITSEESAAFAGQAQADALNLQAFGLLERLLERVLTLPPRVIDPVLVSPGSTARR